MAERRSRNHAGPTHSPSDAHTAATDRECRRRVSLWFTDGARYGCVDARIDRGQGIEVRRREMGAGVHDVWGEDEYESALCLSSTAVAALALVLLAERYRGRSDALEAIEALCEEADIPISHHVWS